MKKSRLHFIILSLLFPLIFFSCVGVVSDISVNDDGSGSLSLTYRVSQMVADIGTYAGEKSVLPLPLAENDFRNLAARVPDMELASYSRKETPQDVIIQAKINFRSIAGLSAFFSSSGNTITFSRQADRTVYSQVLYKAGTEPVDPETAALVRELFADYDFIINLRASREITSANLGVINQDKRQVNFSMKVADIISSGKDIIWEISW